MKFLSHNFFKYDSVECKTKMLEYDERHYSLKKKKLRPFYKCIFAVITLKLLEYVVYQKKEKAFDAMKKKLSFNRKYKPCISNLLTQKLQFDSTSKPRLKICEN